MSFLGEKNFSSQDQENIGILICNLGQTVFCQRRQGFFKRVFIG